MKQSEVGKYKTTDDLKNLKSIAIEGGSAGEKAAQAAGLTNTVVSDSQALALTEVTSGSADACIIDGAGASEFLKNNDTLKMSLLDKTDDCFAIGFPKESPYYETFNNTLKEMMDDGELNKIIAEHLSEQFILD